MIDEKYSLEKLKDIHIDHDESFSAFRQAIHEDPYPEKEGYDNAKTEE